MAFVRTWLFVLVGVGCATAAADPGPAGSDPATREPKPVASASEARPLQSSARELAIVDAARDEVRRGVAYDPAYVRLTFAAGRDTGRGVFPSGDLDPRKGVCTDLVVRALRAGGLDLQERVHADILARPAAYPTVRAPDANIDHRRVGPLLVYLRSHATTVPDPDWRPGDVVVWAFKACPACTPDHVGVVSDRGGPRGLPLVIHNIGPRPTEDDVLDAWPRLGQFRVSG